MKELDARGVAVILDATHSCMTIRGVQKTSSSCVTSAMLGAFRDRHATRAEVLAFIHGDSR